MIKISRIMIIIICIIAVLGCSVLVYADMQISNNNLEFVFNEFNIRSTISAFFLQRHAFLMGDTASIDVACLPIVNDEAEHLEWSLNRGITRTNMQFVIEHITMDDTLALVVVTETITYIVDESVYTASIEHKLTVYPTQDQVLIVVSDEYYEEFSLFKSSSYVSNTSIALNACSVPAGSSLCIIEIAKGEIGYEETGENITKYGEWYGGNGEPWCAMFVSWCAYQANVSESVIIKDWGCDAHMLFFKNNNRFYMSAAYGGTSQPQAGDIIFFGPSQSDSNHVGIVKYVENGVVYYIDGNYSDCVYDNSRALTNTSILGYGRPNYGSSSHMYSVNTTNYNASGHWVACEVCGYQTTVGHNLEQNYDSSKHWTYCTDCSYKKEESAHQLSQDYNTTKHWDECSVCEYEVTEDHTMVYDYNMLGHWRMCTECAYETEVMQHFWKNDDLGIPVCTLCGCVDYSDTILSIVPNTEEE